MLDTFFDAALDQQAAGLPVVYAANPQAQTDTNLKLATLPVVAQAAAAGLPGLTPAAVAGAVTVTQESDTDLANVSATEPSPQLAASVANAYAKQIVVTRQRADANYYTSALRAVNLQLRALTPALLRTVQGADLRDRASSLQILSQLQAADVQVQQPARPPSGPSSPAVRRDTGVWAILGLILGLSIAVLLNPLDRRIREPKELEALYGAPVVGVIPQSQILAMAQDNDAATIEPLPRPRPRHSPYCGPISATSTSIVSSAWSSSFRLSRETVRRQSRGTLR